MDAFDYDEVRWPTRALQQEEEEQAVSTAAAALQPPQILWQSGAQQTAQPQLLVVAMSPASSALFVAALGHRQAVATIHSAATPNKAAADISSTTASSTASTCAQLYTADDSSTIMVCCCSSSVSAEAAPAWARGILQQLQPQRLLLIGTIQADQYRGDADPSQEFTAYLLHTSAAAASVTVKPTIPFLPSGSLVAGLPAALITQAEVQGIAAHLMVVVETVNALVPETLVDLCRVVCTLLHAVDGVDASDLMGSLSQESVVEQARNKLQQTTCRPTSVYS